MKRDHFPVGDEFPEPYMTDEEYEAANAAWLWTGRWIAFLFVSVVLGLVAGVFE